MFNCLKVIVVLILKISKLFIYYRINDNNCLFVILFAEIDSLRDIIESYRNDDKEKRKN